jgi:hypothetical protein
MSGCTVTGGSGSFNVFPIIQALCSYTTGQPGQPAFFGSGSVIVLDRCQVTGGSGGNGGSGSCQPCAPLQYSQLAGAGASAATIDGSTNSTLVCIGASAFRAGAAGQSACGRAQSFSAIDGRGRVHLDPGVGLFPDTGAPPIAPGLSVLTRFLPSLTVSTPRVTVGSPADFIHRDRPGAYAFLLFGGATSAWIPHSAVLGGVDIDATAWLVFGPMLLPGSGEIPFGFTVPNDPTLKGARLYLQTVGIDAALLPAAPPLTAVFVSF